VTGDGRRGQNRAKRIARSAKCASRRHRRASGNGGTPCQTRRPGWIGPAGREHMVLNSTHTYSKMGLTSSSRVRKWFTMCGLRRKTMGPHMGLLWASLGRCFGVSVNRCFGEAGIAPLNAARTPQRDVPTTGAKRQVPSARCQVHFFLLFPVAKLHHHSQNTEKGCTPGPKKRRFWHLTP
jgi:hypothetical protein